MQVLYKKQQLNHSNDNMLEVSHNRTKSSSGGLNNKLSKDETKKLLLKENVELETKLKCTKETITIFNDQVTACEDELNMEKAAWEKYEQETTAQIEKLKWENTLLKEHSINQKKLIKNLQKEYTTIQNLLKFQELRTRTNAETLEEIKSKLTTPSCTERELQAPQEEALTSREPRRNVIMRGKNLPLRPTVNKGKASNIVLKGMIYNPLKELFN